MNTRLLRAIQSRIIEEPRRVNMAGWFYLTTLARRPPACNTIACIGGWAVCIREHKTGNDMYGKRFLNVGKRAGRYLKLSSDQQERLFHEGGWPHQFKYRLSRAISGTAKYAQIVSDRIDHFIATKGAE